MYKEHFIDGFKRAGCIIIARAPTKKLHIVLVKGKKSMKWSPPKGHLEPSDRSVQEGALRETREETGLGFPVGNYPNIDILNTRYYLIKTDSMLAIHPEDSNEVIDSKWVQVGTHIGSYEMANVHTKIINMLTKTINYWFDNGTLSIPRWLNDATSYKDIFTSFRSSSRKQTPRIKVKSHLNYEPRSYKKRSAEQCCSISKKQRIFEAKCAKWSVATVDECDGNSLNTPCSRCFKIRLLHKVHSEYGDYLCECCGNDYSLRYFCIECRNYSEPN